MQIKKLSIKEFGALKNKEIYLGGGINLIEGDNESGKSTLLAFIRFLLYGTPRKSAGETVSEKERYVNWDSGVAEGSMEISTKDGNYRIERRLERGNKAYSESGRIIDLATGTEVYRGEVPGKVFLGITPEVYTSTSCVRQLESTKLSEGDVGASIANLLFAADEDVDTEKIRTKLDDYRRTLLYKNEKGGKLFELESTKRLLEEKLEIAKRDSEAVIVKEAIAKKMKVLSEKTQSEIEEYERQIRLYETCTILGRFEILHAYEAKKAAFEADLIALTDQDGFDGRLPDRSLLSTIDSKSHVLAEKIVGETHARSFYENAEKTPSGDSALAELDPIIEDIGGKDILLSRARRHLAAKKRNTAFAVLSYIFSGVTLALSLLLYFTDLLTPYLGGIPYLGYGLFGGGLVLLTLGILSSVGIGKASARRRSLLSRIGIKNPKATSADIAAHIDDCEEARLAREAYDKRVAEAKSALLRAENARGEAEAEARALLLSIKAPASEDPSDLVEDMRAAYTRLGATCTEKERLENEIRSYERLVLEMQSELKDKDENALLGEIGGGSAGEILRGMDIGKLRLAHNYTRNQHAATEQKRITVEKELIALTSTSESPARISARLYETEQALIETRRQYEAIKIAHETLGIAADNLKKSVTPVLRIRASELMSKITGGKYTELGISTEMAVSVVADGTTRNIDALSKGTKDAAYIALRLALVELICAGDPPPLLFDESFTQLDETRTEQMLNMLFAIGLDGKQSILFTCHRREGQMLKKIGTFHHVKLENR